MINARFMYLRPGNMYKNFVVEKAAVKPGKSGRPQHVYEDVGEVIHGVLAEANDKQIERWKQLQHPISHTIVQAGGPKAKEGDKLCLEERVFFVQGIDKAGSLGISTIYYVEERNDVK